MDKETRDKVLWILNTEKGKELMVEYPMLALLQVAEVEDLAENPNE